MAQLKIDLIVDDHGAVGTLNSVEAATKRVEAASTSSATAITSTSPAVVAAHSAQANEAIKSASAYEKLGTGVANFAKAAGAMFTGQLLFSIADGLMSMGREAIATAGHLVDLSDKTGLSIETLQQLDFVGMQAGVSLDTFSTASFNLGVNLQKTGAAGQRISADMKELGISMDEIKNASPDQQLMLTLTALSNMQDATERNRIGMELFGKSFKGIAPAVVDGFDAMARAADVSSGAQVRAIDAASDAWDRFVKNAKARTISFLGEIALMGEGARVMAEDLTKGNLGRIKGLIALSAVGKNPFMAAAEIGLSSHANDKKPDAASSKPPAGDAEAGLDNDRARTKAETEAAAAARKWREELDRLSGGEAIHAANDWMQKVAQIGGVTRLAAKDQKSYNEALGEAIDAMGRAGKSVDPKMMQAFLNSFQGPAIHGGIPVTGLGKDGSPLGMPGADVGKPQVPFVPLPNIPITSGLGAFGGQMPGTNVGLPTIPKGPGMFEMVFGTSAEFGAKFSKTIMDAITGGGHIGQSIGAMLGTDLLGGLGKTLGAKLGSTLSGIFGAILPGLGGILGSLAGGLIDKLFGSKGRDSVKDFAASMGGFDALHAKLNELGGPDSEKLWINLTQGVGRNNPKEAAAAIQAIQDALKAGPAGGMDAQAASAGFETTADLQAKAMQAQKVYEYVKNSGLYSADAVKKAWEAANAALIASGDQQAIAAQAANAAVTELNGKIQGLQASIANEAPEEVMGVIETQTRAQIAALEQQRAAAQANIDAVKADLQPLVDGGITIPIHFKADPMPVGSGSGGSGGSGGSDGSGLTRITTLDNGDLVDADGNVVGRVHGGGDDEQRHHSGGPIWKRMHRGGLASDEVPIIGQTGEFMMSRRGVAAVGLNNLRRMNNGQVAGTGHSDSVGMSTIIIEQDGRQAARFIVPHIPGEIRRLGLV